MIFEIRTFFMEHYNIMMFIQYNNNSNGENDSYYFRCLTYIYYHR